MNLRPKIVILGRPNVGKTSLFNKLVRRNSNRAIVFKEAGTTIDYRQDYSDILSADLIDTAGLSSGLTFSTLCNEQTRLALVQSQLCLFVIDGSVGVLEDDFKYAQFVRRNNPQIPTILIVNKCDKKAFASTDLENCKRLTFGEPIYLSAEQNIGFGELASWVIERLPRSICAQEENYNQESFNNIAVTSSDLSVKISPLGENYVDGNNTDQVNIKINVENIAQTHSQFGSEVKQPVSSSQSSGQDQSQQSLSDKSSMSDQSQQLVKIDISIIGRPNVGKSTLLNRLWGDQRVVVSPVAGTTRDSISVDLCYDSQTIIRISDTAGIRKNEQDYDMLEKMSVNSTLISIQFANIALLLIDGTCGFERQDLVIAKHVLEEGRGLMILINKSDQVRKREELLQAIEKISQKYLCSAPVLFISAQTGKNCEQVLAEVVKMYTHWNKRITTSKLNNWLHDALDQHSHRLASNNRKAVKIKFITQYDIRPPRFFVNINKPKALDETYKRYLINNLRQHFCFAGIPIRVEFRASANPYVNSAAGGNGSRK